MEHQVNIIQIIILYMNILSVFDKSLCPIHCTITGALVSLVLMITLNTGNDRKPLVTIRVSTL